MRKYLCDVISKNEESLWNLCKFIYDHPELGFHEYRSSDAMINLLRQKNFAIEEKVEGWIRHLLRPAVLMIERVFRLIF